MLGEFFCLFLFSPVGDFSLLWEAVKIKQLSPCHPLCTIVLLNWVVSTKTHVKETFSAITHTGASTATAFICILIMSASWLFQMKIIAITQVHKQWNIVQFNCFTFTTYDFGIENKCRGIMKKDNRLIRLTRGWNYMHRTLLDLLSLTDIHQLVTKFLHHHGNGHNMEYKKKHGFLALIIIYLCCKIRCLCLK